MTLCLGGGWIELLRLLPGSLSKLIHIEFSPIDLDVPPNMKPFPTAGGVQNHRAEITCSESYLKITVRLFGALRCFRHDSLPRVLRADAVCIDQSDVEEKSCQVNLMGEIYGHASRVWSGEDSMVAPARLYNSMNSIKILTGACESGNVLLSSKQTIDG